MHPYKVILINGTTLNTVMPILSYSILANVTLFYSQDNQLGYTLAAVFNTNIQAIVMQEEDE